MSPRATSTPEARLLFTNLLEILSRIGWFLVGVLLVSASVVGSMFIAWSGWHIGRFLAGRQFKPKHSGGAMASIGTFAFCLLFLMFVADQNDGERESKPVSLPFWMTALEVPIVVAGVTGVIVVIWALIRGVMWVIRGVSTGFRGRRKSLEEIEDVEGLGKDGDDDEDTEIEGERRPLLM